MNKATFCEGGNLLRAISVLSVVALAGCAETKSLPQNNAHLQQLRQRPNLLADIAHNGLHFSVSLNPAEKSFLAIHISQRDFIKSSPTVHVRVQMTDDKIIEGDAQKPRFWYGSGGWSELDYQFGLGLPSVLDDMHSVTVTINGQTYELSPF